MPTAFLTGATGFLGRNVLERLLAADWQVHALHRSGIIPAHWQDERLHPVRGDLADAGMIARLIPEGADAVLHIAADTSPWSGHRARQAQVNIEGTRAMLAATRTRNVRRFVHVSSISVFGHHDGVVTEETPQTGEHSWVGYVRTKAVAERLVREAVRDGLDAVILNPAHIMGRYDSSNWARLFQLIDRDALPGVPPGGGCFANVGDVADAVVTSISKAKGGENYILGGPHASFLEVARAIADLLGKSKPERTAPAILLKTVARLADLKSRLTGREPDITPEGAYFVCHDEQASSAKAMRELGYHETPLAQSLADCHGWLLEAGLIGAGRGR